MRISAKDWESYINKLSRINKKAADAMQAFIDKNGMDDMNAVVEYAYALATKYGEASGELACEMYDAVAEAAGKRVPPAEIAPTASYMDTAKAVHGTMLNPHNTVPQTVGRLVKQAGADTTLRNALRDGAKFAWVPHGETCAFCITLASRGWQNVSKRTLRNGHAEHIHANCNCEYAVSFDKNPHVEGYDPDYYLSIYKNADGAKPADKIKSIRHILSERAAKVEQNESASTDLKSSLAEVYERRRTTRNLHMVPYDESAGSALGGPIQVDLGNLSKETRDQFEKTISKLSESYDTSLMKIRTMTPKEALGNSAFATTWHTYSTGSAEMIINPVKCKDYEGLVGRLRELRTSGYIPKIKEGTEGQYIATHEFAHTLLNMQAPVSKSTNWVQLDLSSIRSARKEIEKVYDRYLSEVGGLEKTFKDAELEIILGTSTDLSKATKLKSQLDAVQISRYSLTNVDEFMAECFVDNELGETPSKYSKEVVEILKKYFGRK